MTHKSLAALCLTILLLGVPLLWHKMSWPTPPTPPTPLNLPDPTHCYVGGPYGDGEIGHQVNRCFAWLGGGGIVEIIPGDYIVEIPMILPSDSILEAHGSILRAGPQQ
jgi:hypothetical protein